MPRRRALKVDELATDRPDFTETVFAIPRGRVQVEAGYTRDAFGSVKVDHAPELLIRTGFLPYSELRLGWDRSRAAGRSAGSPAACGMTSTTRA